LLSLKGTIVTVVARNCQREIAHKIAIKATEQANRGDYVLSRDS
jgi:hypothetical protein